MPDLSINGEEFAPFATAFQGLSSPYPGQYFTDRTYGPWPFEGAPMHKDAKIQPTGIFEGVGKVRYSYGGRMIYATLLIVDDNEGAIRATIAGLLTTFTQLARYTIELPGGPERQGCNLAENGASTPELVETYVDGIMVVRFSCTFEQLSETN